MKTSNETDSSPVIYSKQGRVAYVTLNRPHVLNAMNLLTHERLAEIWDDFEADDELWLAVLSGAGDRAFCVGQDLKDLASSLREGGTQPSSFGSLGKPGWPRLTERFDLSKPIIAKVQGFALGGGFELALACDIIVAADNAVFGLPEARLGLISGAGGVFRLTRQLSFKTAMGYLLSGRRMPAERAYELGLVNEIVPAEQLDQATDRWIADILSCAPLSVRAIKQVALASATLPLDEAFTTQYSWENKRMSSEDAKEGPIAFSEGRPPNWRGV